MFTKHLLHPLSGLLQHFAPVHLFEPLKVKLRTELIVPMSDAVHDIFYEASNHGCESTLF